MTRSGRASDSAAIEIPITVWVSLDECSGGERWNVDTVIDERTGETLGEIAVYDFAALSDFPGTLLDATILVLKETDEFRTPTYYAIEVSVRCGGKELGSASRYFHVKATDVS